MNKKGVRKFTNMKAVGNFTKNAIENFEENIVNQTDYLEKVKILSSRLQIRKTI